MTRSCNWNEPGCRGAERSMEGQERSEDLRASRSWEVVHRMPAQADAAQGEFEIKQAQEGGVFQRRKGRRCVRCGALHACRLAFSPGLLMCMPMARLDAPSE